MGVVSTLLARRCRTLQLVAVVALAVILITGALDLDDHTSRVITAATYSPFYLLKSSLLELSQKAVESQQLREKLVDASVKLSLLEEARRENARLRSLLGFEALSGFKIVPAKVVAVYGFELPTAALINRGWKDSIVVDQSIVNQEGLVGRVVAVSADFATVQLLTDPLNRVAARVAASREMGIVRYLTMDGMVLDNFPIQGSIEIGDQILSSGLGGIYPPGLQVGTVVAVDRPEREPFCRVKLSPAVNFHSIEELFILRPDTL